MAMLQSPASLTRFQSPAATVFTRQYLDPNAPNKPILESPYAAVIPNAFPARKGHALVIAKTPTALLKDLPPQTLREMMDLVIGYQRLWLDLPANQGKPIHFSVYVNDGVIAGQTVPHAHIHVVPITADAPIKPASLRQAINQTLSPAAWTSLKHTYGDIRQMTDVFAKSPQAVTTVLKQTGLYSRLWGNPLAIVPPPKEVVAPEEQSQSA